ncbi:MAG: hypothetical protein ACRDLY_19575 [Thermoleophilaceae bacterium]
MTERVHQLLATDVALDKLGARRIAAVEAEQLLGNPHVIVCNPASACRSGQAPVVDRPHRRRSGDHPGDRAHSRSRELVDRDGLELDCCRA